jgi:hypothetical protein
MRWQSILVNGALLTISSVLGVVFVLWALPRISPTPPTFPDYFVLIDDRPGLKTGMLKPSVDLAVQGERAGQSVRWITDGNGFRNVGPVEPIPAPGVQRLILLGDSYIDGMRTDQSQTIGALLEARLGTGHEVLIVGQNNPANTWHWVDHFAAPWRPQRVIVGVTLGNDLTFQNLDAGIVERADGGMAVLDTRRVDGPIDAGDWLPPSAFRPRSAWREAWIRQSHFARHWLAARAGWAAQLSPPETGPFEGAPGRLHERDMYTAIGLFRRKESAFVSATWDAHRRTLRGIARALSAQGIAVTFVLMPVRIQIYPRDWALYADAYGLDSAAFDLDLPQRRWGAICREEKLDCLDTTGALRAAARSGDWLYRPRGDMHFNEAGNAVVAAAIAERLTAARSAD